MTTTDPATAVTTQVHRVYIRATPEAIWDAITKPEWTARYGYGGRADYDLRPGGAYRHHASEEMRAGGSPEIAVDGEVVEADPPRRLVQTWRMAHGCRDEGRGLHAPDARDPAHRGRRHEAHDHPRARGRAAARRRSWAASGRARAPAAAGRGSSATSSRCWRPASGSRTEAGGGGPQPRAPAAGRAATHTTPSAEIRGGSGAKPCRSEHAGQLPRRSPRPPRAAAAG